MSEKELWLLVLRELLVLRQHIFPLAVFSGDPEAGPIQDAISHVEKDGVIP